MRFLLFLILFLSTTSLAQAAIPADNFQDSIGTNTHMEYFASQHPLYASGPSVLSALQQVGITHVRNGMQRANPAPHFSYSRLQYLGNRGIGLDLIMDCKSWFCDYSKPDYNIGQALAWIKAYMPATESVEGENEADNTGCTQCGATGLQSATTRQGIIYDAVRADPWFDGKPVLAPSFVTAASYKTPQKADGCNAHPYPGGNPDTESRMQGQIAMCQQQAPGKPIYFTEYGFPHTAPNSCVGQRGVTETEAATWWPTTFLLANKLGVTRTYVYELFDSNSCNWGLFRRDGTPRPEVAVIRNWIDLLADTNSPSKADTPLTISDPAGADKLGVVQFAKSDGSFWAAIYPKTYGIPNRTITISRPARSTYSMQYHYPWLDTTARGYIIGKDTISVPVVGDNPLVVRIRPKV